jgi:hypothetical protein
MRDGFAPVALKGHYEQDGNVSVVLSTATVRLRAHISATATVYDSDGNPVPQPPLASPAYIASAAQNPDVAEVLEIMGRPDPLSFADLYKVYEIIKHSGGLEPRDELCWRVGSNYSPLYPDSQPPRGQR